MPRRYSVQKRSGMPFYKLREWRESQPCSLQGRRTYEYMTKQELSKILGISIQTIKRWEEDKSVIPVWVPLALNTLDHKSNNAMIIVRDVKELLERIRPEMDKDTRKEINCIVDRCKSVLK